MRTFSTTSRLPQSQQKHVKKPARQTTTRDPNLDLLRRNLRQVPVKLQPPLPKIMERRERKELRHVSTNHAMVASRERLPYHDGRRKKRLLEEFRAEREKRMTTVYHSFRLWLIQRQSMVPQAQQLTMTFPRSKGLNRRW